MQVDRSLPPLTSCSVAVVGLGYVGLPLAIEFSKNQVCRRTGLILNRTVIGFDINKTRIHELRNGFDHTGESDAEELKSATNLLFTSSPEDLVNADVFIISVPTPIDRFKKPDLSALKSASSLVGSSLKLRRQQNSHTLPVVIYESTVFPGATEEVCIPILEQESGLVFNYDFFCGYSPERINPGDKIHSLTTIIKVTSGTTSESSIWVDQFYGSIIEAGTHLASSIKVAEAAKVIENTQRDLNIALINELALIFNLIGIDTLDVLEASGTKWNFMPFRPGLVGGHCIGVDPYYLTHKSEELGYHPEVVLAGRRINDRMGKWIAQQTILAMCTNNFPHSGSSVLLLGFTFKEDCSDTRNTRSYDIIQELARFSVKAIVHDPVADKSTVANEFGIDLLSGEIGEIDCQAIIVAVAHASYKAYTDDDWAQIKRDRPIFDLKGIVPRYLNPIRP